MPEEKKIKKSNFDYKILKVLKSELTNPTNKIDLMVIKWSRAGTPVVEKRRMFLHVESGDWKFNKLAGLTMNDLDIIREHFDEILGLMKNNTDA